MKAEIIREERKETLQMQQLRDGGFVVTVGGLRSGEYAMPVFACGDIETLLMYIRMRYEPNTRERQAAERHADPA